MSLATRCSHCGTIFKIVQDQLKVSEGWVRCGRCNEIFNALPGLFDLEREPPPPRPKPKTAPAAAPITAPSNAPANAQPTPAAGPAASQPPAPSAGAVAAFAPASAPASASTAQEPVSTASATSAFAASASALAASSAASASSVAPAPITAGPASSEPAAAPAPAPADNGSAPVDLSGAPQEVLSPAPESSLAFDWEKTAPYRGADIAAAHAGQPSGAATPTAPIEIPLDPAPQAIESTTDFELDTSVAGYVDKPSTVARAVESLNLRDNPQPWLGAPPEADVPQTDESDALDSRYLMPSTRERKTTPRRRSRNNRGPEFADAEFPDDAFLDAADDEWASGFGPSNIQGGMHGGPGQPESHGLPSRKVDAPLPEEEHAHPNASETLAKPSEEFTPERALEPPSKRTGKPGTRGRDPATHTPEFMRRAHRQAFWRHPITRTVLSLMALGLLATLGLQVAHQNRDLFAAHYPDLRPYLDRWCLHAGCTIVPPLRLDDLQVESATLVRASSEGPDNYRLAVVVHNRAPIYLAWPHVDLTLTDDNGAVIARRAFSPQDAQWLDTADAKAEAAPRSPAASGASAPQATLPAAAPAERSTTLLWHLRAPDIKPAGYTAELFYP